MTNRQYQFVKAVASGKSPVEAYAEVYECSRSAAQRRAAKAMRASGVEGELERMREADRAEARELRMECLAFLLATMRDEDAPIGARLAAAKQAAEIAGLNKQRVEVSADDVFRAAILDGVNEGLVKK